MVVVLQIRIAFRSEGEGGRGENSAIIIFPLSLLRRRALAIWCGGFHFRHFARRDFQSLSERFFLVRARKNIEVEISS